MPKKLRAPEPIVLSPIFPSIGIQLWYRRELDALINAMHAELMPALTDVWPPPISLDAFLAAPMAFDAPSASARIEAALKKWGDKWRKKFDAASATIASGFARKNARMTEVQMREVLKNAGFTVEFKPTRVSLNAYRATVASNVGLIKSIQSEYLTKVQGDVWRAVTAGSDLHTLSVKLQRSYGSTVKRAALIAIDQNAKAKASMERARDLELGLTEAVWMHSSAGKEPRPLHVKWGKEKKVYSIAKGMFDSDENEWIQPGELIRCRCTPRPIIPGFDDE